MNSPAAPRPAPVPLLTLTDALCARDDWPLFAPVTLAVAAGDIVALTGANGIGKSTLLRALAGLGNLQGGNCELAASLRTDRGRTLLYLGHRSGLSAQLSVVENLLWYAALAHGQRIAGTVVDDAVRRVGLRGYAATPCGRLSAGQQRRAALARLCFSPARVWLLDEPLTALDDSGSALVDSLLGEHAARGGAAVVATHQSLACATAGLRLVRDAAA